MPPASKGTIESYEWKDGRTVSWRLRVRFRGERFRLDLGTNHEGWNRERAQIELDDVLRRIERGTWVPPVKEPEADDTAVDLNESLHTTLSRWWHSNHATWDDNTRADYRWRMDHLLLSDIIKERTAGLRAQRIDTLKSELSNRVQMKGGTLGSAPYKDGRTLSPRSVNMILDLLAMALDDAVDYDILPANPARGPRRRLR